MDKHYHDAKQVTIIFTILQVRYDLLCDRLLAPEGHRRVSYMLGKGGVRGAIDASKSYKLVI